MNNQYQYIEIKKVIDDDKIENLRSQFPQIEGISQNYDTENTILSIEINEGDVESNIISIRDFLRLEDNQIVQYKKPE